MHLKNYTSNVPYERTIALIESCLAGCGVTGISKQYDKGLPIAVYFHIDLGVDGKYTIRLPAKVAEVQEYFWQEYLKEAIRPRKTKEDFAEQAVKTAWKIQQDWVQVQMTLIKLQQVDFLQIFMGFVWTGKETYYEQVRGRGLKLLANKSDE